MTVQTVDYGDPPEYEPADTSVVEAVDHDLADIARAITSLGETIPMALDVDDTTATVVGILANLRKQQTALGELVAFVEAKAVPRIPFSKTPLHVGDLLVEVHSGKTRKEWEHDRLAVEVCRDLAVDKATGSVDPDVAQIVALTRNRLMNCAGVGYWRVKQLNLLDIEVDEFCATSKGRKTVELTPAIDVKAAS